MSEVTRSMGRLSADRCGRRPERWFDVQNKWWILRPSSESPAMAQADFADCSCQSRWFGLLAMHAVIRTGGKQYRVAPGDVVTVDRLVDDAGATVTFDEVLMVSDGERSIVGTPLLENASVTGTVAEQMRSPRVIVFKKKRRKHHRKRNGHRQRLTVVRITDINMNVQDHGETAKPEGDSATTAPASEDVASAAGDASVDSSE